MARIDIVSGPEKGKSVQLSPREPTVFGRDPTCTIQLTDLLSSRKHFQVLCENGSFYVEDLGSSNGTLLNEEDVKKTELSEGDEIRLGETRLQFKGKKAAPKPAAKPTPSSRRVRSDPMVGSTLAGYRIDEFIGKGGMGTVYRANQISLNRTVALKILADRLTSDKKFIDMFIREARSAGGLNHPNIVQVYDVGEEGGTHFFSMELMNHGSVGDQLKDLGKLSVPKALEMVIHAAKGLEYAEKKSVVHCDIKPDNLMISEDGVVKIVDLGLSKDVKREGEGDEDEVVFGTPHFIAPEQAQKQKVDHRADIYSLGASFYLMLTGRTPYSGDTGREIALKHIREPLTPVKEIHEEIPDAVDNIVSRMMAKNPAQRYQSATKLLEDLRRVNIQVNPSAAYTDGFPGIPMGETKKGGMGLLVGVAVFFVVILVVVLAAAGVFSGEDPAPTDGGTDGPGTTGPAEPGSGTGGGGVSDTEREKIEAEKRRIEAEKRKLREDKAKNAYRTAVDWEEKNGYDHPDTAKRYDRVARDFPETDAGKRAAERRDDIREKVAAGKKLEEDALKSLEALEAKANLFMKDWYFGRALAVFDGFDARTFGKTAAARKVKDRKKFVRQKASSTWNQAESQAKSLASQGSFEEAKALYKRVEARFGLEPFESKARKGGIRMDEELARLAREDAARVEAADENLFQDQLTRAKAKAKDFAFLEAERLLGAIQPGSSASGKKLRTKPFQEKVAYLIGDLRNLSRLFKQVVLGVGAKKGSITLEIAKTASAGSKKAKVLSADEKGLKVKVGPGVTGIAWTDLTHAEYYELARLVLPRNPASHLLLAVHAMFWGGSLIGNVNDHLIEAKKAGLPSLRKEAETYSKRFSSGSSMAGREVEEQARRLHSDIVALYKKAMREPDPQAALRLLESVREKALELKQKFGHTKFVRDLGK